MNSIRKIVMFIGLVAFILFFIYVFYINQYAEQYYIDRKYYGIIKEIRVLQGTHDLPDIKINNDWISFDIPDAKVKHYILVGDSIVKDSGTRVIKVYRKNLNGKWDVKIFK